MRTEGRISRRFGVEEQNGTAGWPKPLLCSGRERERERTGGGDKNQSIFFASSRYFLMVVISSAVIAKA